VTSVISRAAALRGGAASLGAALFPRAAFAQSKLATIRIGVVPTDVSGEPYYADAQGIFRRAGLDAQVQTLSSGGAIVDAIAGGALDVGFSNLSSAAQAHARGIPIALLTPATLYRSAAPVTLLMKARGSKLARAADLNGKIVGVDTLHGLLQVAVVAWLEKNGGDAKSVRFVEIPFASMAPALKAGRIDAAMMSEPSLTTYKNDVELLAKAYDAIAPEFLIGGFVVNTTWMKANGEVAKAFVSAMAATARWANAHHAETATILSHHTKASPAVIRSMTRATYGEHLSDDVIQPVLDVVAKYGTLRAPMKATELIAAV
jgi:NitT/TauT family transport system substrate-binding protein